MTIHERSDEHMMANQSENNLKHERTNGDSYYIRRCRVSMGSKRYKKPAYNIESAYKRSLYPLRAFSTVLKM